jgi:hypothetical protein
MDDFQIQQIVDELDAAVTKDDAKLLIYYAEYRGEHEDGNCELIGNRKGYIRAGIEMLRAAVAPLGPNDIFVPINIDYLIGRGSLGVKRITRQEDVDAALPPVQSKSWKTNAIGVGCMLIVIFGVVCAFMGLDDVVTWLLRK